MSERVASRAGAVVLAVATALVILGAAVVPFLSPAWVAFAQDRADAQVWTGYTPGQLRIATDAILSDLVIGPPAFDATVAGEPVLNARERGHLRDVRTVFAGLAVAVGLALLVLVATVALTRARSEGRVRAWRAAGTGAGVLALTVVGLGVVGLVAFDAAFEVFHRLLFAGGTYTFDPRTERLVQLFPMRFWFESALAVGVAILVVAVAVVAISVARARANGRAAGRRAGSVAGASPARLEHAR